jgi:hypothetical protein
VNDNDNDNAINAINAMASNNSSNNDNSNAINAINAIDLMALNPANIFRIPNDGFTPERYAAENVHAYKNLIAPPIQLFQEPTSDPIPKPKPQEPSICIPRVFMSTTRKDIYDTVEKLGLGAVDRIDLVFKTNDRGEPYNKVFIHFKVWNTKDETARATREKLLKGEEIKIVYRDPWFWKCTASRVEKPTFRDYSAPPPRIDLGGCKSLSAADAVADA